MQIQASPVGGQGAALAAPSLGEFTHTIDGRAEGSDTSFDVINPATGLPFARCPDASEAQLDRAVAAARRAFKDWSRCSFAERAQYIHKFAQTLGDRAAELAPLLTREQGKPLAEARGELIGAATHLVGLASIELADHEVIKDDATGRAELRYRPLGVVGAITPWNAPVVLACHKIAAALYTGNTMVLKPSPYTPLSTLKLGEIARDTLPPGVLNVIAGGNDLGRWISEHADIDRISFTGSLPTGKHVMASASKTLKRVSLELGGNDPAIVLDDIDVAATVPKLFNSAFRNCGQICMAIKRLYVHERIYEAVVEGLAAIARSWRIGDGMEPDVQMGPINNKMQYDKVMELLADTRKQSGVRIAAGGQALDRPGYFLAPTIVADIAEGTRLVDEEPFGPILPVIRYSDVEDAVRRANDTRFGLSGSVWSGDEARAHALAQRLEVGTAWVNFHSGANVLLPFGGAKESGLGRELGVLGLRGYMEPQIVHVPRAVPPR
jgi:acyl-CoA reductase-like NAD-dependent aldehyde dehydrogenase